MESTSDVNSRLGQFESSLHKAERNLTYLSLIPYLGSLAGIAKVSIGAIQLVSATFVTLAIGLPKYKMHGDGTILNHGITHIMHGAANIERGFLETIPMIGLVFNAGVLNRGEEHAAIRAHIITYRDERCTMFPQK
jgi:hypothetical protein